jgi:hypothetical protein
MDLFVWRSPGRIRGGFSSVRHGPWNRHRCAERAPRLETQRRSGGSGGPATGAGARRCRRFRCGGRGAAVKTSWSGKRRGRVFCQLFHHDAGEARGRKRRTLAWTPTTKTATSSRPAIGIAVGPRPPHAACRDVPLFFCRVVEPRRCNRRVRPRAVDGVDGLKGPSGEGPKAGSRRCACGDENPARRALAVESTRATVAAQGRRRNANGGAIAARSSTQRRRSAASSFCGAGRSSAKRSLCSIGFFAAGDGGMVRSGRCGLPDPRLPPQRMLARAAVSGFRVPALTWRSRTASSMNCRAR